MLILQPEDHDQDYFLDDRHRLPDGLLPGSPNVNDFNLLFARLYPVGYNREWIKWTPVYIFMMMSFPE
jgi:hypothetical protein